MKDIFDKDLSYKVASVITKRFPNTKKEFCIQKAIFEYCEQVSLGNTTTVKSRKKVT